MSLPIETIAEIAENVYFTVIEELNLEYKCIEVDDNGSKNTEYGMELYYLIESAVQEIVGGNDDL